MDPFGCALAVSLAVTFAGGAPPEGDRPVETVIQDDALMLHGSEEQGARRGAGDARARRRPRADHGQLVRGRAGPGEHASARSSTRPIRSAYQEWRWGRLDRAVKAVVSAGMKPMLDVAFFAPRWAVERGAQDGDHRWRPSAPEFGQFSEALARRYNGGYEDPVDRGGELPAGPPLDHLERAQPRLVPAAPVGAQAGATAPLEARLAAHLPRACTRPATRRSRR